MKKFYTNLPPFIIHLVIHLYLILSILLEILNLIFSAIKNIKFKIHIVIGMLLSVCFLFYSFYKSDVLELKIAVLIFAIYIVSMTIIKIIYKPFGSIVKHITKNVNSYFFPMKPNYIVIKRKDLENHTLGCFEKE